MTDALEIRTCKGCTACCYVMQIPELSKPANTWCDKVEKGRGCTVYDHRPGSCVTFQCMWLRFKGVPSHLSPKRTGVMLIPSKDGKGIIAFVSVDRPYALMEPQWKEFLLRCDLHQVPVVGVMGKLRMAANREAAKGFVSSLSPMGAEKLEEDIFTEKANSAEA